MKTFKDIVGHWSPYIKTHGRVVVLKMISAQLDAVIRHRNPVKSQATLIKEVVLKKKTI